MKFLPGKTTEIAQESISSQMLVQAGINNPDFIPTILRLYKEYAPLNYILDVKGLKTSDLNLATNGAKYKTVGSNHVKYLIDSPDYVIPVIKANIDGVTFKDDVNGTTNVGKNKVTFSLYSNSNWAGFQEIIELADNQTQLYILNDPEEVSDGVWELKVKLWSNDKSDTIDTTLLAEGMEYMVGMTAHEQDFSVRGNEKYLFKGMGDAFLTVQRFKYSWSGTAAAMKTNNYRTIQGNKPGAYSFMTEAEDLMMKKAAEALNFQYLWGKTSVSYDTLEVMMHNGKNQEVLAGSGIVHSNDGPIKLPFNRWTKTFLHSLIKELKDYIGAGIDGTTEVVMLMATASYLDFQFLMGELGKTQDNNLVGSGSEKGFVDTYSFYEIGGVRLIAMEEPSMAKRRPGITLQDGSKHNEWDTLIVPLRKTNQGNNGIELIQLRPMSKGTVAGIDAGGNIATSVDGSSTHVIFQNGIINQNQIFWLQKPW